MKKLSIILGVVILILILANLSQIVAHTKLYSFNNNKKVTNETKVITFDEIFQTLYQQMRLAQELRHSMKYSLIGDEVLKGLDDASDYEMFLGENNQIKSIKVKFPITTYKDDDMIIKFISGKGEVLGIFENGQWTGFNGSWNDLIEKYNPPIN
ncbi:hypothetical protein [Rossellomorea aquimaris]|uniref:hypothetical protein n=1 Tax=Rossellomorea aquimaris TaxID=189382 RepID=UPI0007D09863|nr:hypothetical protein [Rossellomorea aquimaris]